MPTESDSLQSRLHDGCVLRPKRWIGDTHADLGGSTDEEATDLLMTEAADRIVELEAAIETHHRTTHMYDGADITDELQAEREMWALVGLEPDPDAI